MQRILNKIHAHLPQINGDWRVAREVLSLLRQLPEELRLATGTMSVEQLDAELRRMFAANPDLPSDVVDALLEVLEFLKGRLDRERIDKEALLAR